MSQIVRDEYGRHFYLHNADDAWKISDSTANMEWGTWEPIFTNNESEVEEPFNEDAPVEEVKGGYVAVEAVIDETYNFLRELNDLVLVLETNWERAKVYELMGDISEDIRRFIEKMIGREVD
jgi:hypothetical protein